MELEDWKDWKEWKEWDKDLIDARVEGDACL